MVLFGVIGAISMLIHLSCQRDLKSIFMDKEIVPGEDYVMTEIAQTDPVSELEITDDIEIDSQLPPQTRTPEERLYNYLFNRGYVKNARPAMEVSQTVVVKVGMCVMMLEDLIEREQMMIMAACAKMVWTDERLQWDPAQFNNLTWMSVPSNKVWIPEIVIVNSPNPAGLTGKFTSVGLDSKGELGFFPSGWLFTRCNLIITYFPFDWQRCHVHFESWVYTVQYLQLELFPDETTISWTDHYENYQWTIKGHRVYKKNAMYDGKNFSSVTITFVFRRKSLYFSIYFIFPELLLAILQTLSHILPVEHPGRMTMLTALFIGNSVTHAAVTDHIPKSSDTMSLLQVYMTIMTFNLVFSLLVTFLMLYTALRYPDSDPSFLSMFHGFASVLWPYAKKKPPKTIHKIAELPEEVLPHYLRLRTTNTGIKSELLPKLKTPNILVNDDVQNTDDISIFPAKDGGYSQQNGQPSPSNRPPKWRNTLNNSSSATTIEPRMQKGPENKAFTQDVHSDRRKSTVSSSRSDSEASDTTPAWEVAFSSSDKSRRKLSAAIQMAYGNTSGYDSIMVNTDHTNSKKGGGSSSKKRKTIKGNHYKTEEESLDLKRRWLMYCVALDKSIMYFIGVINLVLPTVLFLIAPMMNEVLFTSRTEYVPHEREYGHLWRSGFLRRIRMVCMDVMHHLLLTALIFSYIVNNCKLPAERR